LALKAHNKSL